MECGDSPGAARRLREGRAAGGWRPGPGPVWPRRNRRARRYLILLGFTDHLAGCPGYLDAVVGTGHTVVVRNGDAPDGRALWVLLFQAFQRAPLTVPYRRGTWLG